MKIFAINIGKSPINCGSANVNMIVQYLSLFEQVWKSADRLRLDLRIHFTTIRRKENYFYFIVK